MGVEEQLGVGDGGGGLAAGLGMHHLQGCKIDSAASAAVVAAGLSTPVGPQAQVAALHHCCERP